jgi:large subunit ribosomal protein L18e
MGREKDNQLLASLIGMLGKEKKPIWRRVRDELNKPRRRRAEVNLSKIDQYGSEGGTVIVPGKVLGSGSLTRKMNVAAFSFSDSAKQLISSAGGKAMSIADLHSANPDGKDVRLLK